jgi:hypothetical protein
MSETPKRLTWEEIGKRLCMVACPGDFHKGAPKNGPHHPCFGPCEPCWAPYMPESTPTDKEGDRG